MILTPWNIILLLLIGYISYGQLFKRLLSKYPIVENSWTEFFLGKGLTGKQIVFKGYHKYSLKARPWQWTQFIVLPPSTFDEARKLNTNVIDASVANEEGLCLAPFLGDDHTDVINLTRQDITRSIPSLIPILSEEIKFILPDYFAPPGAKTIEEDGNTWYSTKVHPSLLAMVGRISTRIFFGKKYSRDKEFTEMASKYANGVVFQAYLFLGYLPRFILPIIAPFMVTMRRVRYLKEKIRDDVMTYISDTNIDETTLASEMESKKAKDTLLLAMMVKYVQKRPGYVGADNEKVLAGVTGRTLGVLFAAIDTTTMTLTHLIYDLISTPKSEYIDPIMQQIREVHSRHGGQWSVQALGELKLLDSFIKESQRLHPITLLSGSRKVMPAEGYTFRPNPDFPDSEPIHVRKGSLVIYPAWGIHSDSDVYPDPETFKGFRFAQDAIASSQPTEKFMSFGHSRHACPGRHLALTVVKLMVIEFLTSYDWKVIERPRDLEFGLMASIPDLYGEMYVSRKEIPAEGHL